MELVQFIKKMISEKKSTGEVLDAVAQEFPEANENEVLDAVEAAEKAFSFEKALFSRSESQKKDAELSAKVAEIAEKVATDAVEKVLEKIPVAQPKTAEPAAKTSFDNIFVTKDGSWETEMSKMLKLAALGQKEAALKISADFDEKSKYGSKAVLRGDTSTGYYAVPDEFNSQVFSVAERSSKIFADATKLPMMSDKMYLLSAGNVGFTEVADQGTDLTESEPTLAQTSIDAIDVGAYSLIHNNLIDDSFASIPQLLADSYGRGLAIYTKRATTVGNVATTGDKINGIYSTSGIGSVAVADPAGAISDIDIWNLVGSIGEVFLEGAHFEMNFRELIKIKQLKASNGEPLFTDYKMLGSNAGGASSLLMGYLLGFPVFLNNQMPITIDSATGARTGGTTATILFGNAKEAQIGVKGGFKIEASDHYKWISRQTTFRGFLRWGFAVISTSAWAKLTGIK